MHLLALIFAALFVATLGSWDRLSTIVGPLAVLGMSVILAAAALASAWLGYRGGRRGRALRRRERSAGEAQPPPRPAEPPPVAGDLPGWRDQQRRQTQQQ